MSGVLVWIETFDGKAVSSSWEALGAGRTLADEMGEESLRTCSG